MEKFQPRASQKIKLEECEELKDDKYAILKQIFDDHRIKESSTITRKDLWFWKETTNQDSVHEMLWNSVVDTKTDKIKVDQYLVELVYCMNNLSQRLDKISARKDEFEHKIQELGKTIKNLNDNESKYDHRGQKLAISNDTLNLSYISSDRKSYNLLASQHKLIFKAGLTENDGESISEEGNMVDTCRIKMTENIDSIKIKVLALVNKKENILSVKNLPTEEIYTSIDLNAFVEKEIPPIFLIIPYETDSDLAESKEVEIRFDLRFTYELRLKILERMMKKLENQYLRVQKKEEETFNHIVEVLDPFKNKLKFKSKEGYKETGKSRACESCNIF